MELDYILRAARRWWYIIGITTIIGIGVAVLSSGTTSATYRSEAVLLITPPSASPVQAGFTNDPDRYVLGQMSVLQSQSTEEAVAKSLGNDTTADHVESAISITRDLSTDIVRVRGDGADAATAQRLVAAYVAQYFTIAKAAVEGTLDADIAKVDAQLATLRGQIADVNAKLEALMAPYLANKTASAFPGPDVVGPDLVSQRALLEDDYSAALTLRTTLDTNNRLHVTSQIVQQATLPTVPVSSRRTLALGAGAALGLLGGVFVALVLTRRRDAPWAT